MIQIRSVRGHEYDLSGYTDTLSPWKITIVLLYNYADVLYGYTTRHFYYNIFLIAITFWINIPWHSLDRFKKNGRHNYVIICILL